LTKGIQKACKNITTLISNEEYNIFHHNKNGAFGYFVLSAVIPFVVATLGYRKPTPTTSIGTINMYLSFVVTLSNTLYDVKNRKTKKPSQINLKLSVIEFVVSIDLIYCIIAIAFETAEKPINPWFDLFLLSYIVVVFLIGIDWFSSIFSTVIWDTSKTKP